MPFISFDPSYLTIPGDNQRVSSSVFQRSPIIIVVDDMKFTGMLFAAQIYVKLAIAPVPLKIIAEKIILESEIKILALNSVKSQFIVGNRIFEK